MALREEILDIATDVQGTIGIVVKNLNTGESFELRADQVFGTASVIKVAIMVELFRCAESGDVCLDDRMEFTEEFRVGGSGLLKEFSPGLRPTLRDLCLAMIAVSDNVATNMLIAALGIPSINDCMRLCGLEITRLHRPIAFSPVPEGEHPALGVTAPREMLRLFEMLARGEVVSPSASAHMIGVLARQQNRTMFPRFLPDSYDAVTGTGDPLIAGKTGSLTGVRNEVALFSFADGRRWIISAFSQDLRDERWSPDNEGELALARISRAVYDSWARLGPPAVIPILRIGGSDVGKL